MQNSAARDDTSASRRDLRPSHLVAVYLLIFVCILLAHLPWLRLPYFWDEAGYYIPAARDLLLSGDPISHSTLDTGHTPLVMAYLALAWKLFGFSPLVSRFSMLLLASLALAGTWALARQVANPAVAWATTLCVAVYPVFFAQSSLAHIDMAAAAFTLWGLFFYLRKAGAATAAAFSLAALAKETSIITPLTLLAWELLRPHWPAGARGSARAHASRSWWLLLPALPLALWFAYHYHRTGHVFGGAEYFRYNVAATMHPARALFALLRRAWQLAGHMNLYALTLAAALAMQFPARGEDGQRLQRIAVPTQIVFAVVVGAHLIVFSIIGGAVLARYLLPALPLVILICVSTIWRRLTSWVLVIAAVCAAFVAGIFINPPYVFAPEDNLAYVDYVRLHQNAGGVIASRYAQARVLTAWPATDELSKPYLGYVPSTIAVLMLENFSVEQLQAAEQSGWFDVALVFSRKYQPTHEIPAPRFWKRAQEHFFDYRRDVSPETAAQILDGRVVYEESRGGQWIALIEPATVRNAASRRPRFR